MFATLALTLSILFSHGFCDETFPVFGNQLIGLIKISQTSRNYLKIGFDVTNGNLTKTEFRVYATAVPFQPNSLMNCESAIKDAQLLINTTKLDQFEAKAMDLWGNTLTTFVNDKLDACITLIPAETFIYHASMDLPKVSANFFLFPLNDTYRLVPMLTTADNDMFFNFSIVTSCATDGSETVVNKKIDRNGKTIDVVLDGIHSVEALFVNYSTPENYSCKKFEKVNEHIAEADSFTVKQKSIFCAPTISSKITSEIEIASSCDNRKHFVPLRFIENYSSDLILIGNQSSLFKNVISSNGCKRLLPGTGFPLKIASIFNPISGNVFIVDAITGLFVVSDLHDVYGYQKDDVTISLSGKSVSSTACTGFVETANSRLNFPVQSNKETKNSSMFNSELVNIAFNNIQSIQVDMGWTKVCSNITLLENGAIEAIATLRTHNIASSRRVSTLHINDYPLLNRSTLKVLSDSKVDNVELHARPIDLSVNPSPPCSETIIGSIYPLPALKKAFTEKKLVTIDPSKNLIQTILGRTVSTASACGTLKPVQTDLSTYLAFFNDTVKGFVKLSVPVTLSKFIPTQVDYNLHNPSLKASTKIDWEIVSMNSGVCQGAIVYDPFRTLDNDPTGHAIGNVGKVSSLYTQTKAHFNIPEFYFENSNNYFIRLKFENKTICAPLKLHKSVSFLYSTLSLTDNTTLSQQRDEIADNMGVNPTQVAVDYTREFHGGQCSTFTVTTLLTAEQEMQFGNIFDPKTKKFVNSKNTMCSHLYTPLISKAPKMITFQVVVMMVLSYFV